MSLSMREWRHAITDDCWTLSHPRTACGSSRRQEWSPTSAAGTTPTRTSPEYTRPASVMFKSHNLWPSELTHIQLLDFNVIRTCICDHSKKVHVAVGGQQLDRASIPGPCTRCQACWWDASERTCSSQSCALSGNEIRNRAVSCPDSLCRYRK